MLQQRRRARRDERGFTLIELLIVIVILGILAAVVVFAVNGIQDRGTTSACKADVQTVTIAAEAYNAKNGEYAPTMERLVEAGLLRDLPSNKAYQVDYVPSEDGNQVSISSTYCPGSSDSGASSTQPSSSGPSSSSQPTRTVIYRINAGGPGITSTDDGPGWSSDMDPTSPLHTAESGNSRFPSGIATDASVPASTPNEVFDSERFDYAGGVEMQWSLPVNTSDHYTVRLYFANRCGCTAASGARVFNVALDGTQVLGSYDVFASSGYEGTMKHWDDVKEPDGAINIDFSHVVENPLINGIEIIQFSD